MQHADDDRLSGFAFVGTPPTKQEILAGAVETVLGDVLDYEDRGVLWLSHYTPNDLGPVARFNFAAAVVLRKTKRSPHARTLKPRTRSRASHGTRRGHVRRTARRTTSSAGSDDPGPSEPPRLRLAPKPGAVYTFGVRAREVWGLE